MSFQGGVERHWSDVERTEKRDAEFLDWIDRRREICDASGDGHGSDLLDSVARRFAELDGSSDGRL